MINMVNLLFEGKVKEARGWHEKIFPFCELTKVETNPTPIKAMMEMAKMAAGPCRLPLTPLLEKNQTLLKKAFSLSPPPLARGGGFL